VAAQRQRRHGSSAVAGSLATAVAAWRQQLGGSVATAVAAAARWQRGQLGYGGQLGSGSISSVAVRRQWQQLGSNTSAAAAVAVQQRQWQFCSGGQLGGGGSSLGAAAWQQHGRGGRLLLDDCCLFLPLPLLLPPVSSLPPRWWTYPRERGKTGFRILCCYQT
jgi:hypothetical protein